MSLKPAHNPTPGPKEIKDQLDTFLGREREVNLFSADGRTLINLHRGKGYLLRFRSLGSIDSPRLVEENHFVRENGEYEDGNGRNNWQPQLIGVHHFHRRMAQLSELTQTADEGRVYTIEQYFRLVHVAREMTDPIESPLTLYLHPSSSSFTAVLRDSPNSGEQNTEVISYGNRGLLRSKHFRAVLIPMSKNHKTYRVLLHDRIPGRIRGELALSGTFSLDWNFQRPDL